ARALQILRCAQDDNKNRSVILSAAKDLLSRSAGGAREVTPHAPRAPHESRTALRHTHHDTRWRRAPRTATRRTIHGGQADVMGRVTHPVFRQDSRFPRSLSMRSVTLSVNRLSAIPAISSAS